MFKEFQERQIDKLQDENNFLRRNNMKTCETCKWWKEYTRGLSPHAFNEGFGACFNQNGDGDIRDYWGCETNMRGAYTEDGSTYYSILRTKKTFGCNEWEK